MANAIGWPRKNECVPLVTAPTRRPPWMTAAPCRGMSPGAVFKPIEPIAIKIDWQQRKNAARTGVNQWNVGLGYLF